jgi:hypothetical protein
LSNEKVYEEKKESKDYMLPVFRRYGLHQRVQAGKKKNWHVDLAPVVGLDEAVGGDKLTDSHCFSHMVQSKDWRDNSRSQSWTLNP